MNTVPPVIRIVDDEASTRQALERLLRAGGFLTRAFASAEEFLHNDATREPGCLILDVYLPGVDGLELQRKLQGDGGSLPIVFLTCHGTIPMSVRAIQGGAVDFLTKPVDRDDLFKAIESAVGRDATQRAEWAEHQDLRTRQARLTPREQEVFKLVVRGRLNKQIAAELGTGEQTIKIHRSHVMQKMRVTSLADLVRLAGRLQNPESSARPPA